MYMKTPSPHPHQIIYPCINYMLSKLLYWSKGYRLHHGNGAAHSHLNQNMITSRRKQPDSCGFPIDLLRHLSDRTVEINAIKIKPSVVLSFHIKVGHIPNWAVFYSCKYISAIKNAAETLFMSAGMSLVELGEGRFLGHHGAKLHCQPYKITVPSAIDMGPQSTLQKLLFGVLWLSPVSRASNSTSLPQPLRIELCTGKFMAAILRSCLITLNPWQPEIITLPPPHSWRLFLPLPPLPQQFLHICIFPSIC